MATARSSVSSPEADGPEGPPHDPRGHTYSEEWRRACEVRWILATFGFRTAAMSEYLRGVSRSRGSAHAMALWLAVKEAARQQGKAETA